MDTTNITSLSNPNNTPNNITAIIPCADYHTAVLEQAIASCYAQTLPIRVYVVHDTSGRGAGWARNRGLFTVDTPFVVFLDADDTLEPTFAERTMAAYTGERYIYTDWYQDSAHIKAPDCAWTNRTYHLVSALVPTAWAQAVGGFDESLFAGEDTDFYLKLCTTGRCGQRLAEPLLHYRKGGRRGLSLNSDPAKLDQFTHLMTERYGRKHMSCCGDYSPPVEAPTNEQFAGAVLARALWGGNQTKIGAQSGMRYPRTGNGKLVWVDQRDVLASPNLWQIVPPPLEIDPYDSIQDLALFMMGDGIVTPPYQTLQSGTTGEPAPDFDGLLKLYKGE